MKNNNESTNLIEEAKSAALDILLKNIKGPIQGLPRTAGWGYPEAYTRDIMISALGFAASGNKELMGALKKTLLSLSKNQSKLGHIPSFAHNPNEKGASDTTALFLIGLHLYRISTNKKTFLEKAAKKALMWLDYQSPDDSVMVGQLPTSDWRDEQWVLGFGLYVNSLVYACLKMYGFHKKSDTLKKLMNLFDIRATKGNRHVHEGLVCKSKPYYALYSYKIYHNERFDLLGNSLAILAGIASISRGKKIIRWVEKECLGLRKKGHLTVDLPPCLVPFIQPKDPDWKFRYEKFNRPGNYHNGGIWPFICGFYIAACVSIGEMELAKQKLLSLAKVVKLSRKRKLSWGFNEWVKAQTGLPEGRNWQTWSAAMYLYAYECVEQEKGLYFESLH